MITFSERQDKGSQTCGGYSLAAVLVEMRKTEMETKAETKIKEVKPTDESRGRTIYNEIQKLQNESNGKIENPFLQGIVEQGQSLPSFICQVAGLYKLNMGVCYSQNTLHKAFTTHISYPNAATIACEAITEEKGRIGDAIVTEIDEKTIISEIGSKSGAYYIVLVNNATHWVVVQQYAEDKYSIYDPADQMNELSDVTKAFSGLFIKC